MEPFFFGPPGEQLFAALHRPTGRVRGAALLCGPPGGQAVRFHRPLRRLAEDLCARGWATVRFDLRGCGDSAGSFEEASLTAWGEDLCRAAAELRVRCGELPLAVVGLRLAGSLAALCADRLPGLAALLLWDPVVDGRAWLAALERQHASMLQSAHVAPPPPQEGSGRELLGYLWGGALLAGLATLDLSRQAPAAGELCLLETDPGQPLAQLAARWREQQVSLSLERHPDPELWHWRENFRGATARPALLRRIADWLDRQLPPVPVDRRVLGRGAPSPAEVSLRSEQACVFAEAGPLVGVLHRPARPTGRPGFVFLDSGLAPRTGHNRVYVKLARALCARGFPVLRFDFSGIGDSPARPDARPVDEASILETRAAIDRLAELGCTRFVLLGVCAGGRQAYRTALLEPRVDGLVMINVRAHLHERPAAGLRLRALLRHGLRMTLASSFARRARRSFARGEADGSRVRELLGRLRPADLLPRWRERAQGTRRLLARGVRVLQVHAEADEGVDYLAAAWGPERGTVLAEPGFEYDCIAGSNHSFTLLWSQERLLASVVGWASARFPSEEPSCRIL